MKNSTSRRALAVIPMIDGELEPMPETWPVKRRWSEAARQAQAERMKVINAKRLENVKGRRFRLNKEVSTEPGVVFVTKLLAQVNCPYCSQVCIIQEWDGKRLYGCKHYVTIRNSPGGLAVLFRDI